MIRRSGPCPDPELFAFCISMSFFDGSGSEDSDPDPRIRIRVRVSPNSFIKIFTEIFLKEIGSAPPFSGSVHVFTILALLKKCGTRFED
jgi:hypothetical protein